MKKIIAIGLALVLSLALAVPALAAATVYTDKSAWEAAVGTWTTEDFSDATLNPGVSVVSDMGYVTGGLWWDRVDDGAGNDTTWTFDLPIFAWGGTFDAYNPGGPGSSINVTYVDGTSVVVGTIPNTIEDTFWGFVSDEPFIQVHLEDAALILGVETYEMDDMVYSFFPQIEISKTADRTHAYEGDTINYLYRVHNNGGVPLGPVAVFDSLPITPTPLLPDGVHNRGDLNQNSKLDPCETWYFTANYTVPDPCARTWIPNTGTAVAGTGLPSPTRVSAESNLVEVRILHPCIELEKWTVEEPPAYYNGTKITYYYGLHNCGDTPLEILVVRDTTLEEDATEVLGRDGVHNRGDLNNNGAFEPCETWYFSLNHTLVCETDTYSDFCNTAMAGAFEPILESRVVVRDVTWKVRIFQWQPRTIGYWGNWDNHYTDTEIGELVNAVKRQSCYFADIGLQVRDVHDLLLGKVKVKGKMDVDKATYLLEKQLLATWFNVKSYEDWVGDIAIPTFEGSPDAAMDPNATVYVDGEAMTVQEILDRIEYNICTNPTSDVQFLLKAKDILDDMNNAESNHYLMFMDPSFDPTSSCR